MDHERVASHQRGDDSDENDEEDKNNNTENYTTPKDVFVHLLSITSLVVVVISFIALVWQYINASFPDQLDYLYYNNRAILSSIASLAVLWPVFILVNWLIGKDIKMNPEKRVIKIRKWLLYLALFIASITIIIDLVAIINNFLN